MFILNKRLENDTHSVTETDDYILRMHKNALIPWLILVPKTQEIELFACELELRQRIRATVDSLTYNSMSYFNAEKMNVATIGNVVSQLHIHIIARKSDDFCWPEPVWGKSDFIAYSESKKNDIIAAMKKYLSETQ